MHASSYKLPSTSREFKNAIIVTCFHLEWTFPSMIFGDGNILIGFHDEKCFEMPQ